MPRQAAAGRAKKPRQADEEAGEIARLEILLQEGPDAPWAAGKAFSDLPLSAYTQAALQQHKFVTLTAIQKAALPPALAGRDVLGAAKTGSGKTLSFLLPVRLSGRCLRLRAVCESCLQPQSTHTTASCLPTRATLCLHRRLSLSSVACRWSRSCTGSAGAPTTAWGP